MANAKSSRAWLRAHQADPYVKLAQQQGFRSRAAYKLLALDEKDRLFSPGQTVLDLGASPGAWSQLAKKRVGPRGTVLALDMLPMAPIEGVNFIQGDLCQEKTVAQLLCVLSHGSVDLVISDMAPNLTGISSVDQPRMIYLAEVALDIAGTLLKPQATLLLKCFQGVAFEAYLKKLRSLFAQVLIRKPPASRSHSSEVYLVAKRYQAKPK